MFLKCSLCEFVIFLYIPNLDNLELSKEADDQTTIALSGSFIMQTDAIFFVRIVYSKIFRPNGSRICCVSAKLSKCIVMEKGVARQDAVKY